LKLKKKHFFISGIFFLIGITSFVSCRQAGSWLVKQDILKHADAIVLLMDYAIADGILQAAESYTFGYANHIILVKENMDDYVQLEKRGALIKSNTEQCKSALIELGVPIENITILDGKAENTLDEALILSEYQSTKTETDTLILVSSAQSTRRASIIFNRTFKSKSSRVVFLSSPSKYGDYQPVGWWKRKEDIQKVLSEYFKLLNFWVFE